MWNSWDDGIGNSSNDSKPRIDTLKFSENFVFFLFLHNETIIFYIFADVLPAKLRIIVLVFDRFKTWFFD